jgi:hypothetical protein
MTRQEAIDVVQVVLKQDETGQYVHMPSFFVDSLILLGVLKVDDPTADIGKPQTDVEQAAR